MATPMSGTPQSGRKRPAAATATTGSSKGNGNSSRVASMTSPRGGAGGSSLLTPEPAQKRRGVSRGGGTGTGRSGGHEGGGGGGGGNGNGNGNGATPTSVFTPGTGTAHLLLQLRRDWAQQQQQQQQQFSSGGGNSSTAPQLPLQQSSSDAVGSAPTAVGGEENLSEDAAALIRSCSYAVAPGGGGGGGDSGISDKRGRPAPTSGAAAATAAGSKGGAATRTPRGSSGSRRGGRGGGSSSNSGGATVGTAGRPKKEAVGAAPAGIGSSGLPPADGSGMPYGSEAVTATSVALDGCSCKKSMCLKLYCQCFAGQHICSDACKCENCLNSDAHGAERRAAVRELLSRSPHAFDAKFKTEVLAANGGTGAARAAVVHNTGCGCSKSACLKRYCECFNGGIACSDRCRCKDCRNTAEAVGARVRAKNMAAKSSMLSAGAAAVAAAKGGAGLGASAAGAPATAGAGRGGGRGAAITGGGARGSGGGAFSGEVAAAATAAAAAVAQHGTLAKTAIPSSEEGRRQDGGHGKGNIDVGGGVDGAAFGRSPLGVLPGGRADGDGDSGANRSTVRV